MTKLSPRIQALFKIEDPDGWLVPQVEAHHSREIERRSDPGWFHPSSLDHPCDAYLAFDFLGMTRHEKIGARLQRIFDLGSGRDEDWKRYLSEIGISLVPERPKKCPDCGIKNDGRHICLPELRIRGSVDDVVRNPVTGKIQVFEFKTKNDALWKKLKEPDASHVTQVHPYMAALHVDSTVIVYENKNTQELKEFRIAFDPARMEGIAERCRSIMHQLRNGWAPERVPQDNEPACPHFKTCGAHDFAATAKFAKQLIDK